MRCTKNLSCRHFTLSFFLFIVMLFVGKPLWISVILVHLPQIDPMAWNSQLQSAKVKVPLIFLYNDYFGSRDWGIHGTSAVKALKDCPIQCQFTSHPSFLKKADMVLVHLAYYGLNGKSVNIPNPKEGQIVAGYLMESPSNAVFHKSLDGIFDWGVTYRRDSDVFLPYGRYDAIGAPYSNISSKGIRESLSHKKLAAWLVSNCGAKSQRDSLVENLKRHIPVDVFGACSKRKCPETEHVSCRDYLGQNYKFYLSFENSLCNEYVTEKFFLAYQYNMVPVTFGWANYSLYGPPGSYINALDYNSVEDLANYLSYLDKHDDEYLNYFNWRGKYNVKSLTMNTVTCKVCQTLSNHMNTRRKNWTSTELSEQTRQVKRHPSFKKWYQSFPAGQTWHMLTIGEKIKLNTTSICVEPKIFPMFEKWIRGE